MAYQRRSPTSQDFDFVLKIILIGDPSVGKSSLLFRYIDDHFDSNYICTIGVDFKIKTLQIGEKNIKLQVWDTAGQERFKPITKCYFKGSHGCVTVFDVTNKDTYQNARNWMDEYNENNAVQSRQNLILIGNKCDQEGRVVSSRDGESLARQYNCSYLDVSAKTGENVEALFISLAEDILQNIGQEGVVKKDTSKFNVGRTVSLESPSTDKKRKCC